MSGIFYEDYTDDWTMSTGARTVTEFDVMQFVTLGGFNEALFLDAEYIKASPFKKRIAPGALGFTFAEGLVIGSGRLEGTGMAYLGSELTIKAPLFVGDTIRVELRLKEKRETSKPDRGIVTTINTVRNQRDEVVLEYTATRMIRRRGA